MIKKQDLVKVRRYIAEVDKNYILATWLNGLRYGSSRFRQIESRFYFNTYNKLLNEILENPETEISIICFKDDPEVILAYAVFKADTLHWAFTKPAWRNLGFAKSIIPPSLKKVTHLTEKAKAYLPLGVTYEPLL